MLTASADCERVVVIQRLFEDDFGLSKNESSNEEGEGIFAYAGQQHLDTVELATLSSGVEVQPSICTGANLDVSGKM